MKDSYEDIRDALDTQAEYAKMVFDRLVKSSLQASTVIGILAVQAQNAEINNIAIRLLEDVEDACYIPSALGDIMSRMLSVNADVLKKAYRELEKDNA